MDGRGWGGPPSAKQWNLDLKINVFGKPSFCQMTTTGSLCYQAGWSSTGYILHIKRRRTLLRILTLSFRAHHRDSVSRREDRALFVRSSPQLSSPRLFRCLA
jgi:hypothetical protein